MTPDMYEYWVGSLAMAMAISHSWLQQGQTTQAQMVLNEVLTQFAESPVMDDGLKSQLAEYWIGDEDDDDDSDVLRPLRV